MDDGARLTDELVVRIADPARFGTAVVEPALNDVTVDGGEVEVEADPHLPQLGAGVVGQALDGRFGTRVPRDGLHDSVKGHRSPALSAWQEPGVPQVLHDRKAFLQFKAWIGEERKITWAKPLVTSNIGRVTLTFGEELELGGEFGDDLLSAGAVLVPLVPPEAVDTLLLGPHVGPIPDQFVEDGFHAPRSEVVLGLVAIDGPDLALPGRPDPVNGEIQRPSTAGYWGQKARYTFRRGTGQWASFSNKSLEVYSHKKRKKTKHLD